jgi:hypothetical protein
MGANAATTEMLVSRLYQATFGASERCSMASPEAAKEFKAEFDRFSGKYPELLRLLKSSPYFEPARQRLSQVFAAMTISDTPQSLAAECAALAHLLRSMIDQPEGERVMQEYTALLAAK